MITLPIYYTKEYKTKPSKSIFVGLNWFRNAHYHEKNEVKQYYHQLIKDQITDMTPFESTYVVDIKVYYKNIVSDGHNVANMFEKFTLDALQESGIVKQDNVTHHLGTVWSVAGQDKLNPRVEITILSAS